ncbi:DNA-binding protein RFX2-like isoform X4, partial [Leptotrombidium deliense]
GMQQTATTTATTATAATTKVTAAPSATEIGVSSAGSVTAVTSTSQPSVKLEQLTAATATTTAAQVITVVAPSHTTQAHGQPVVVQVSSGGQFIAVAVSPDNATQTTNSQPDATSASVGTPATNVSTEDEDQATSSFDDFASAAAYTNGNSNSAAMTYYTTDSYTTATAYYNSSVTYSQDAKQLQHSSGDNAVTVNNNASSNTTTTALLINPFSLHTASDTNSTATNANSAAIVASVVANAATNSSATAIVATPAVVTTGPATNLHHQNVRDMDIVHVQWLIENYETAEGVSLPRSTLYSHYQQHCQQHGIEPVNAASFGKLIRSVFIGLRTRRLGTRGNSKYHYYGIRVKPGSTLSRIMDQSGSGTVTAESGQPATKRSKTNAPVTSTPAKSSTSSQVNTEATHQATLTATSPEVLQTYLGDPKSILSSVWPEEPTVSNNDTDSPSALATRFAACYRKHYEQVINSIGNLQFNAVEELWHQFWQGEGNSKGDSLSLSVEQLHQLTATTSPSSEDDTITSLADWIIQTDYTLYNSVITSLLLPNLLKPIPQQLTQQIRNFAKNINCWMSNALIGFDETFIALKVSAVSAFSHTLRRYTSLNHLSSAARAVLQNQQQIEQMISDLNRVDFKNVQEQASWVCQCDDHLVEQIEQSFKLLLQEANPFDKWGLWCEQVLDMCLQDNEVRSSTQFFFKWGFYSSLVMRDLTLRSASSFGSFHLIRLLFDEYIFYLIEHRVAKQTGKTPLQVLGEVCIKLLLRKLTFRFFLGSISSKSKQFGSKLNRNHVFLK